MGWFVPIIVGALVVGAAAGRKRARSARRSQDAPPPHQFDQLEQLRRYGTSDDAARLIAEGRGDDLAGLGYRGDH